jgi:tetratricopeptide (TPR) repeat protein
VLIVLARTLGAQGDWTSAAACYKQLIAELSREREVSIRRHDLHAKYARALRRAGDHHGALREAAQALLLDPLSPITRREVGKAHFALQQYDEAIEAWGNTLWLTPNDPHLHWRVAFCHWSAAQDRPVTDGPWPSLEHAAEGFERAALLFGVEMIEGWAWSHLWAGRVHAELGDPGEAIRHLRNARGCKQTEMAASLLLGEAHQALGETTLSRERLRTALDLARSRAAADPAPVDWGHALSVAEIAARAELGLGRWALADGNSDAARTLASAASVDASRIEALKPREPLSREAAELLAATGSCSVNGNGARPAPRGSRLRIASWMYPG